MIRASSNIALKDATWNAENESTLAQIGELYPFGYGWSRHHTLKKRTQISDISINSIFFQIRYLIVWNN